MAKKDGVRTSLYFSRIKDTDIIDELDLENIDTGVISYYVKQLMRDGIKYREQNQTSQKKITVKRKTIENKQEEIKEEPSTQKEQKNSLLIKKKEMSDEEITARLLKI